MVVSSVLNNATGLWNLHLQLYTNTFLTLFNMTDISVSVSSPFFVIGAATPQNDVVLVYGLKV